MYKPDEGLLKKYAQVMVRYALNNGHGIKSGDTVFLVGQENTKDLFMAIADEIYAAGGNLIPNYMPDSVPGSSLARLLLQKGTDEQITFFAKPYWQGIVEATDHICFILSEPDIHYLEGIPSAKISLMNSARAPYMKMREEKEQAGQAIVVALFIWHTVNGRRSRA
jgi:aminopeptidase